MGIQPRATASLPEDRERHRGPGTKRTPGDVVGPTIVKPPINAAAQTSRGKGVSKTASGLGENPRTISRNDIPTPDNYRASPE